MPDFDKEPVWKKQNPALLPGFENTQTVQD
jgi:hypothetical protein